MIKKYNDYIKESLLDKLNGPTKEEISNGLRKRFSENKVVGTYFMELIRHELLEDILELLDKLDNDDIYIPYVIKYTYKFNKPELRQQLFENLKINLDMFYRISISIKNDLDINISDNKHQIYNELDEIENILKYRNKI